MKIACVSDTHMNGLPLRDYPKADILVHAGDATFRGTVQEVKYFAKELAKHFEDSRYHDGYQQIIFVPGNHDWLFEREPALARQIMLEHNIITLINDYHVYEGIKFWGSPVCPPFHNWAFYRGSEDRKDLWSYIPDDTDILITHGPPLHMRDECYEYMKIKYCGCEHLQARVKQLKPKVHIFGHIHESYGVTRGANTLFVNAALMDGNYRPNNKPILIEVTDEGTDLLSDFDVNFNVNSY